jgi:hypothetical protein
MKPWVARPIILFTFWLIGCARIAAVPLTLTTLVRTNDPAPGVGPTTIFTYSSPNFSSQGRFGAPAAANGGYVAFSGQARNTDNTEGGGRGIWGGRAGALFGISIQRQIAPGLNTNFTQIGLMNVSDTGKAAFFSETFRGSGLWWSDLATGATELAQPMSIVAQALPGLRPLQTSNFIAFVFGTTNWVFNTATKQLIAVSYTGMPAEVFGGGITLSAPGTILALTEDGRLLLQANTSDGTNRIFLANGPNDVIPALAQGQAAPGVTNQWLGFMGATGNARGMLAMLTRLDDRDANPLNDRSALFAGPATNVTLIALSPPGQLWGGKPLISRANHIYGPSGSGTGIYQLPDSPEDSVTFTPLPEKPYPPRAGASTLSFSLNALGQFVEFYGTSPAADPYLPGTDLWLFNPGDGWTNIARAGSNLVASGQTILVQSIGFQGNSWFGQPGGSAGAGYISPGGAGYPSGLADDGALVFSVNGTHIITTAVAACPVVENLIRLHSSGRHAVGEEFFYNGKLGPNWHAATGDCPPETNWETRTGVIHPLPPGDASPGTATVVINGFPGETIDLDRKPASIGSLNVTNGLLRLREHLTLNRDSGLYDLRMEVPNGALTVNAGTLITNNFEWASGTVDGTGSLAATNVFITNGTTVRLHTALASQKHGVFDNGGTLIMSNGVLRTRGEFILGTGTITNSSGLPPVQNLEVIRKQGVGDFTIYTPYHAFEALLRVPPWGLNVEQGRLSLLGGGRFFGYHTNVVKTNAVLELAGDFQVPSEEVHFHGKGRLELGTANTDFNLRLLAGSFAVFRLGRHTVSFNRGAIDGFGTVRNTGRFLWRRGTIASDVMDASPFINELSTVEEGFLEIDSADEPRTLGRVLVNQGTVLQQGTLSQRARILNENNAFWRITRSADLLAEPAAVEFINRGYFLVEPETPGVANVDAVFESSGEVVCGKLPPEVSPGFVLRFRGAMRDIQEANRELVQGTWVVYPGCRMEFEGKEVAVIGKNADVTLRAGEMPFLNVRENYGRLALVDTNYSTSAGFTNGSGATLIVSGGALLTVNGPFVSEGAKLECLAPAVIDVKSGAVLDGQIRLTGKIKAAGILFVLGKLITSGVLEGSCSMPGETDVEGNSPGVLVVVGSLTQTNSSVLTLDLEGTATNQYDHVLVSGNAQLGGTLAIRLPDSYRPTASDQFAIVQAGSVTGRFSNAPDSQRVATVDGYGTFLIQYTSTNVVISDFQADPNAPPTSPARLVAPSFGFGLTEVTLTGTPGRSYTLQTSTNLLDWLSLLTNNAALDGQLRFELPISTEPYRFFRALNR